MEITWTEQKRKLKDLSVYERNPRRISKIAFEKLKESLRLSGYNSRLLINLDNTVVSGHQRIRALKELGVSEIDVLVPNRLLTPKEFERVLITSNISAGEFDMDLLANEFDVDELIDWGMDPALFPDIEVIPSEEDDASITPPVTTDIVYGDLYQLGEHRLLCGDSTVATDVSNLFGTDKPNLMVTDPPYGVNYDASWREGANLGVGERSKGKVANDDQIEWTDAYSLFPGDVAYVWHAGKYSSIVQKNLEDCEFELVNQIIWVKQHFAMSRGDYHWQHEPCHYVVRKGKKHNWQGARDQSTTWEIKNNNSFGNSEKEETFGHSTQKPIECMLKPIQNNSAKGDYIYDPFGGSGTTLIAAEQSGRNCLMMEIMPIYCDMIIKRWEKLTGSKAVFLYGK